MKYCNQCGRGVVYTRPVGDTHKRYVCDSCATVHYQNPNIVAGVIAVLEDKIILCKRAIEPRQGLWTVPAGYMENGESVEQAAVRESQEEANLTLGKLQLYTVTSLPHINQVYMLFRGELLSADFSAGEESLEVGLYAEADIPWAHLAFPVIRDSLKLFFEDQVLKNQVDHAFPVRNLVYEKTGHDN